MCLNNKNCLYIYKKTKHMKILFSLILLLSLTIKAQDVTIGTQTWTSKNLDVTTYRNGDTIPRVDDLTDWNNLTTGAWCYYENETANGKLYNWYAVNDPRGLAPRGYYIPSDAEWTRLTDYLGGKSKAIDSCGRIASKQVLQKIHKQAELIAGIKMESTQGWEEGKGNNSSGFAGFPGGRRDRYGIFEGGELKNGRGETTSFGFYGYWWSSSSAKYSSEHANFRSLTYKGEIYSNNEFNRCGFSVRCLRDSEKTNNPNSLTKFDHKSTQGVTIGKQIWTSKNLDVSKFRNGEAIPMAEGLSEWQSAGENSQPAWCYCKFGTANGTTFGKLYNWFAVSDPRGLAPSGYHIPTDAEWTVLINYLGGEIEANTKMKSTTGWKFNDNGTNTSGFEGLPEGNRGKKGYWSSLPSLSGTSAFWWSSSEHTTYDAWYRGLGSDVNGQVADKRNGYSVRCLRD